METAELAISSVPDELLRGTSNEATARAVRSVTSGAQMFACASRPPAVAKLLAAGASYVFMPAVETANGVLAAANAALAPQLDDFRAARELACGPLTARVDAEGMSL